MELWIGALNLSYLYAFMTMGVFITARVFNQPDITVDGSFTTGAATAAVLIAAGYHPLTALAAAFVAGSIAGAITGIIHTRWSIHPLLAGILVMTGLYSVNLHIMGRSNIPLLNQTTLFSLIKGFNPGLPYELFIFVILTAGMVLFWLAVSFFFLTDMGVAMRATGSNVVMASANGIHVSRMVIFGMALANGLVGVSGGLVAQYQGFADIGMGIGTIVIGLAAVIIGESLIRSYSYFARIFSVVVGSAVFRLLIAVALYVGMNPIDLKLMTSVFVLLTLVVSQNVLSREGLPPHGMAASLRAFMRKPAGWAAAGAAMVLLFAFWRYLPGGTDQSPVSNAKIGVVQLTDNGLPNTTRDGFLAEMRKIGYKNGETCTLLVENANGDLPTINTILDKFLNEDVDVVVTISTQATQAAISKIQDRPVVFATVANPFLIGAGTSESEHLPHVTGVYGWVPMDKTVELFKKVLPGKRILGAIWDPSQANAVFNVENLKKAVEADPDLQFQGVTITGSNEVYQAAQSLAQKGIDAFVLPPDNIVYSAFESVVNAAQPGKIPIFISDVERLADGALAAVGYDYTSSGIQAARLVDRILKGANPRDIPFERYAQLTIGLNLKVAQAIGITLHENVLAQATMTVDREGKLSHAKQPAPAASASPKRAALFLFSENEIQVEAAGGFMQELKASGVIDELQLRFDPKNAQNDFALAQSIAQEIVGQKYDYVVTFSTPALQVMAQVNQKIPHIFGAVTDPYRMGVAKSPEDHISNLTGVATFQPVETTIRVMRELFPQAKRMGIIWNPAEACSEACTYKARAESKAQGFELLEVNVSGTSEVMDALNLLLEKRIDLFLTSGDNTVVLALSSIAERLRQKRIPYFTNSFSDVEKGAFLTVGADYAEVGRETARMAAKVMRGEDTKTLPINNYIPEKMYVNVTLAREYGVTIPEAFLKRAAKVQ